jgi:hypothetical protein
MVRFLNGRDCLYEIVDKEAIHVLKAENYAVRDRPQPEQQIGQWVLLEPDA